MLSDQSRPVIEATLPVVGEHIGEIDQRFYRHLFDEHPELLDGMFSAATGRGEKQHALAGSVASFAAACSLRRRTCPSTCSPGSRTSTRRWASTPTSTRSSTTT